MPEMFAVRGSLLFVAPLDAGDRGVYQPADLAAIAEAVSARRPPGVALYLGHGDGRVYQPGRPEVGWVNAIAVTTDPADGQAQLRGDLLFGSAIAARIRAGELREVSAEVTLPGTGRPPRLLGVALVAPPERSALGIAIGSPVPAGRDAAATFAEGLARPRPIAAEPEGPTRLSGGVPVINRNWPARQRAALAGLAAQAIDDGGLVRMSGDVPVTNWAELEREMSR